MVHRIPRADFAARRHALSAALEQRDIDGWVACANDRPFSGGDHVRYLSDFQTHFEPVYLVGRGDQALLLTGPESTAMAELDVAGTDLEVRPISELSHPGLEYGTIRLIDGARAIRETLGGAGRVAVVGGDNIGRAEYQLLFAPLEQAGVELVTADEDAYRLRAVKTAAEHEVMQEGYRVSALGISAAAEALAAGANEREIAAEADAAMLRAGAESMAIATMVASGERSRPILARSTSRRPAAGEVVAVTVAPRCEGYCVSMARPFLLGENPEIAREIETAWAAQAAAVERLVPGVRGSDATVAARDAIAQAGTAAEVIEVWVHSGGVMEFEPPYFTPGADPLLEAGMAISIDVPLFMAPWGGLRIEDGFVLEAGGARPRTDDRQEAFPWQM